MRSTKLRRDDEGTNIDFHGVLGETRWAVPLLFAGLLAAPTPVHAAGLVGTQTPALAIGDFDGDGGTDYAYGYPNWSFGEGKVVVVYDDEAIQIWNRDSYGILLSDANYNYFGDSIAAGDFDGDGYDDIAVGIPREDLGVGPDAGAVNVIYGTSGGLSTYQDWYHQNQSALIGTGDGYENFGGSLLAGNFDGNTYFGRDCDDLAIGIPGDMYPVPYAGAVTVLYGHSSGLLTSNDEFLHQNYPGVVNGAVRVFAGVSDLTPMACLTEIRHQLYVQSDQLGDLSGFANLTRIDSELEVGASSGLQSLSLPSLQSVPFVSIYDNLSLTDLVLPALTSVSAHVEIRGNLNLSECRAAELVEQLQDSGSPNSWCHEMNLPDVCPLDC